VLGVGLASWAMWLKLEFNFDWALLLAIVAVFGIMQLVVWLRKRGE
jgi:cyanate permease